MIAPVLVLHGTRGRNATYGSGRERAVTLPGARLFPVEGATYQLWADASWELHAIGHFLKGEWPAKAQKIASLVP